MPRSSITDISERLDQIAGEMADGDLAMELMWISGKITRALDRIAGALGMPISATPRDVADRVGGLPGAELISACQCELAQFDGVEAEVTSVWPIDGPWVDVEDHDPDDHDGQSMEHVGWIVGWRARYTAPCGRAVSAYGHSDEICGASVGIAGAGLAWLIIEERERAMRRLIAEEEAQKADSREQKAPEAQD